MDFSISIPTLLILLAIIVLFRLVDKRNRSLEKLKRFADRTREELSLFIRDKGQELHQIATGIDEELKKGREILKRILSFEEMLKAKASDFDKMKKTVDDYASTLQELVNMSGRVDANLKRLGEESVIVEELQAKLKSLSSHAARLEGELKQSEKRFLEQARQELGRIEGRILQAQENKALQLQAEITKVENRTAELDHFLKKLDARKQETLHEAESFLKEHLKGFTAEVSQQHSLKLKSFASELATYLEESKAQGLRLSQQLELSQKRVQELEKELEAKVDDFKTQFSQVERIFYNHLENAAKRGEDLEDEVFTNLKKNLEERLRGYDSEIDKQFAEVRKELEERRREIVDLFGALRSDTNVWHAQLKTQMKNQEKELEAQLASLNTFVKNSVKEAMATSDKAQQAVETKVTQFVEKTSSRLKQLEEELGGVRQETEELFQALDKKAKSLEEEVLSSLEKRLTDYEEEVSYRFTKLEASAVDVEALEQSLRDGIQATSLKIKAEFASLERELASQLKEERSHAQAELEQITVAIRALNSELDELKASARASLEAKLVELSDELLTSMKEKSEALEKRLLSWHAELEAEISHDQTRSQAQLEKLAQHYQKQLERELAAFKKNLEGELASVTQKATEFEASITRRLAEKENLLASLAGELGQEVEKVRTKTMRELDTLHKSITAGLASWQQQMEEQNDAFTREMARKLSEQEELLKQNSEDLKKNIETIKTKAMQQLAGLEETVASLKVKASDLQKGFLDSFEPRRRELEERLDEIEKRTKDFLAQTKLFERADSLKISLDADISLLKKELAKIEATKKEIGEVASEFYATKKMVEDVSSRLREFMAEKKRIELIDSNFRRLVELSKSIDDKLAHATSQHDLLQSLELKFREFESLLNDVEARFERLENKKKILDTTTTAVDKNFEQLTALEKELKGFERELHSLPKLVSELKREVEFINNHREKTSETVAKINRLDDTLTDIEARMEKLGQAREWLARTETRLTEISKQADEQLSLLGSLLKEEVARSKKDKAAPDYDKRQMVTKLARQGWSVEEIARATKLSRGEVELILELISGKV